MTQTDIRFYFQLFARRFHYFVVIALSVAALGTAFALRLPRVFQADAKMAIEFPQIRTDLARPTVVMEAARQLQMIELKLMTRAELVPIATKFNLYAKAKDIVDDMRSRTKIVPIQTDILNGGSATAFMVSFMADDPVTAADVVNEYVRIILQRSTNLRTSQASDTLQFFQKETDRLATQLGDLEGRILDFKKQHKDALPESLGFRRSQQIAQQERLLQLEREEASLADGRIKLARDVLDPSRALGADAMTPKERILDQLLRTRAEQRSMYSDASPSIVALNSQIAQLENEVRSEAMRANAVPKARPVSEKDIRLAEISQRLNLVAQDKAATNKNLASLSQSIAATPAVEAELSSLERERQNLQAQYGAAVARLADASTGQQIELGAKGERLSILETAAPPRSPTGRKRLLIAAASVVAGIVLGCGFLLLLELLNNTVRRPQEMIDRLDIEPLATLPYIRSEAHRGS
jgi:uncharacterized protein involved in exopolysaccharide biosynthesis